MPTCFCVTRGCYSSGVKDPISHKSLGRNVDGCTYKAHMLANKQVAFRVAEENAELALTAQIEEITTHLSASVLADNVSGPSLVPGGPLWSRNGSEDHQSNNDLSSSIKQTGGPSFPSSHSPLSRWSSSQSPPTSSHSTPRRTGGRRSQEVELIACLSELEQEVNSLRERALEGLTHLGHPAIPAGLYKALKTHFQGSSSMPREAKVLSSYTLNGLKFSTFTRHRGNSFILVRRPSLPSIPARIESILQTPANDTFL